MSKENLIIAHVDSHDKDWYSISTKEGVCFGMEAKYGVVPKSGDKITLHSVRGSQIRGIDLNGVKVYYKTDEQLEQEHKEYCENAEKKRLEEFEKNKESLDAKYEALPQVFKDRINKFRTNNPKFRVEYESYEMFCCEQAIVIAEALKTKEAIDDWKDLDWEKQKEKVPALDDGHSGNTFGCSCILAHLYLEQPENVAKMYGALAPLVGSDDYGCVPKKE